MNITNSQANYAEFFHHIEEEKWWLASQPIVDLKEDIVMASELLLRVGKEDSPLDNSLLFPKITLDHRFLEVSFKIWNLINQIIETKKEVFSDRTFINICPQDIKDRELVSFIKKVNKKFLSNEKRIVLELSEQFSEQDILDSKDKLSDLINSGIEFALDDYGLGILNLDFIQQAKVSYLKFDKSICVDGFKENNNLIKETLLFCNRNNIISLAEGVESDDQRDFLLSAGFKLAQGFLFGKPKKLITL